MSARHADSDFVPTCAACCDELIDHPVEMVDFTLATFEAGGIHEIIDRAAVGTTAIRTTVRRPGQDLPVAHRSLSGAATDAALSVRPWSWRRLRGLEHPCLTALADPAAATCAYRGMKGSSIRLSRAASGFVQPRVFPQLERQADQPAASCPTTGCRTRTMPACYGLRRHHLIL